MRYLIPFLLVHFILTSCYDTKYKNVKHIIKEFHDSTSSNVLVVAHRGDWRNAPENSIKAIENCIEMGVDIVEIDIRKTKDNQLVLMHDNSIDRTTNGKGNISDYTLNELNQYYLKEKQGGKNATITVHKIPSLEEALVIAKGKVMLNLDKAYGLMPDIYPLLTKHEMEDEVILKGGANAERVVKDISYMNKEAIYMPVIPESKDNAIKIEQHIEAYHPVAIEIFLNKNDSIMELSPFINEHGARVWINSLWASLCLGHEDAKALKNPDANWGWIIAKGATIICTDNPKELLEYLKIKGFRNF